ncbi:hypothetical protein HK405_004617, partial [Cladochytrium tenue]
MGTPLTSPDANAVTADVADATASLPSPPPPQHTPEPSLPILQAFSSTGPRYACHLIGDLQHQLPISLHATGTAAAVSMAAPPVTPPREPSAAVLPGLPAADSYQAPGSGGEASGNVSDQECGAEMMGAHTLLAIAIAATAATERRDANRPAEPAGYSVTEARCSSTTEWINPQNSGEVTV